MIYDQAFTPRETWRRKLGSIQSRNALICDESRLFVGTCGEAWNVRDCDDGVHCLNRSDGASLWFTPTTADVNEICLAGSSLVAPTDAGDVFVLDAATGRISAVYRADSPVLGKPLVTDGVGGWSAIFASLAGTVYLIEEHSQTLTVLGEIGGGLRASLVRLNASEFLAATENGRLVKGVIRGRELRSYEVASAPADSKWGGEVGLAAAPLIVGTKVFAGYTRSTYDEQPAVFCVDLVQERVEWTANAHESRGLTFGNVRTTPALIGNRLVVASAYSEGVDILDAHSGVFLDRVRLGKNVFQQWSGPVSVGEGRVAIGRVDGVCSIVDVQGASLVASVSLATAETERLARANEGKEYTSDDFALYPGEPAPDGGICGTPLVDKDMLFVGTTDGIVVGVRLQGRPTHH